VHGERMAPVELLDEKDGGVNHHLVRHEQCGERYGDAARHRGAAGTRSDRERGGGDADEHEHAEVLWAEKRDSEMYGHEGLEDKLIVKLNILFIL
jgi:hypothetical protein